MGFRLNHLKVGPFRLNLSAKKLAEGGNPLNSVSLDAGVPNFRLWSQDGTRGLTSIDTPGQGSIRLNPSKRKRAARQQAAPLRGPATRRQAAPYDPETGYPPLTHTPTHR